MFGLVVIVICFFVFVVLIKLLFCYDLDCLNYIVFWLFGVSFIIKRDMFYIIYYINCICFVGKKILLVM